MIANFKFAPLAVAFAATINLSGCISTTYSGPERDVVPVVDNSHSAVMVRVSFDGKWCAGGAMVRLTPLSNGQLQYDRSVDVINSVVPVTTSGYSMMRNAGRSAAEGEKYATAFRQIQLASMKQSFTPLPPGDYVATYVRCTRNPDKQVITMGASYRSGWLPEGSAAKQPILGDNFIRVSAASAVDAGTLDIRTLAQGNWLQNGTGMIVGVAIPLNSQKQLRAEYPEAYAKVKFGKFTSVNGNGL